DLHAVGGPVGGLGLATEEPQTLVGGRIVAGEGREVAEQVGGEGPAGGRVVAGDGDGVGPLAPLRPGGAEAVEVRLGRVARGAAPRPLVGAELLREVGQTGREVLELPE